MRKHFVQLNIDNTRASRSGCHDMWNAFLCDGAKYCKHDIPFCPTTADSIPSKIINWVEAKAIYKKEIKYDPDFFFDAFVCFYIDDYKFDSSNGIWFSPMETYEVLRHFDGTITPDFSTCQDFPEPIKIYATYRMRAYGFWLGKNGLKIINNVRWGTKESYIYCFEGIPQNSIVCIGTVGGSPNKKKDRCRFDNGFYKMLDVLKPKVIITYGSANYPCFAKAAKMGIMVKSFPSQTAEAFERRKTI